MTTLLSAWMLYLFVLPNRHCSGAWVPRVACSNLLALHVGIVIGDITDSRFELFRYPLDTQAQKSETSSGS